MTVDCEEAFQLILTRIVVISGDVNTLMLPRNVSHLVQVPVGERVAVVMPHSDLERPAHARQLYLHSHVTHEQIRGVKHP